jgi:hypothetical protein
MRVFCIEFDVFTLLLSGLEYRFCLLAAKEMIVGEVVMVFVNDYIIKEKLYLFCRVIDLRYVIEADEKSLIEYVLVPSSAVMSEYIN